MANHTQLRAVLGHPWMWGGGPEGFTVVGGACPKQKLGGDDCTGPSAKQAAVGF